MILKGKRYWRETFHQNKKQICYPLVLVTFRSLDTVSDIEGQTISKRKNEIAGKRFKKIKEWIYYPLVLVTFRCLDSIQLVMFKEQWYWRGKRNWRKPFQKKGKKKIYSNFVLMTFGWLDTVGNVRGEMILKGQRCSRGTNIEGETILEGNIS